MTLRYLSLEVRSKALVFTSLASLLQAIILFFIQKTFRNPVYGVNDDVILNSLISGYMTGDPILWTYFSQPSFNVVPFTLKLFSESISWFYVYLFVVLIISQSLLFYTIQKRAHSSTIFIISLLVWLTVVVNTLSWGYLNPTFTYFAVLISIFSASTFFMNSISSSVSKPLMAIISLFFWISYSIRSESLFIGLIFLLLFTLVAFGINTNLINFDKVALSFFALPFIFLYIVDKTLLTFFLPKAWQDYYLLQNEIGKVHPADNKYLYANNSESLDAFLGNTAWNQETFSLFQNFMLFDKNFISINLIKDLSSTMEASILSALSYYFQNLPKLQDFTPIIWQLRYLLPLIAIILLFGFLVSGNKFKFLLFVFLIFFTIYFIFSFLASVYKLPERIYFPVILSVPIILFILIVSASNHALSKLVSISSIIFFLVSVFFLFQDLRIELVARDSYQKDLKYNSQVQYEALSRFDSDSIFIGNSSAIQLSWISPYDPNLLESRMKNLVLLGWHNPSPAFQAQTKLKIGVDDLSGKNLAAISNLKFVIAPHVKTDFLNFLQIDTDNIEILLETDDYIVLSLN